MTLKERFKQPPTKEWVEGLFTGIILALFVDIVIGWVFK